MESINFVLCIVYLALGIVNMFGVLKIEDSAVFGMTVGTLFLCIAPLVKNKKIRIIMYIVSAGFILGFPMINGSNKYIQGVDSNTWLLLSLSVTFLANYIGTISSKKIELENRQKELNQRLDDIETLKNEIKKLNNKK
ncbi:hypothetical protein QOZ83_04015 [Romboutsia sedimentorum]|uniref:hypothetical protein n=1 Tax=Romboutsia sedimentorum TaxID=1368474 RepID=UPI0024DE7F25|nr:hypothetical protein [Romboutsia sedimentorum]MDK2585016.1 hypothetical protein [Romboutsia sedimentorum]